ncbi:hypothetical protein PAXRUDRAFT_397650 [Paxillus rubicundulus Ve08.2h10]|uniref:Uncharacterized protein n=1 Tax=Paxillus rubicundulus Ve08.2h10 TaxID=930991 RepID=A0A0D0DYF5_9AGAM|nr:hypothetical protein PAXRUDRAFT_397650 [Paxillus rubicundulus Ve08.2h10]
MAVCASFVAPITSTGECGVFFCHIPRSDFRHLAAWWSRDRASLHRAPAHRLVLSPLYPRYTHMYTRNLRTLVHKGSLTEHSSQVSRLYLYHHQHCPDVNRTLIAQHPGI